MSRYTVLMTYSALLPQARTQKNLQLPGQGRTIELRPANDLLSVTATRVQADSPVVAVMAVKDALHQYWGPGKRQFVLRSWTSRRELVLVGARRLPGRVRGLRWGDDGWSGWSGGPGGFNHGPDDEGDGTAGVREPRRPLPGPGSMTAALELPEPPAAR